MPDRELGLAPTQRLGQALADAGVEGLLYPSARLPGARCLVVFTRNLAASSRVS